MIPYQNNILLNLVTCGLIFWGGIGFLVIQEMWSKRFHWRKFSMHTKIVVTVSLALIISGTVLLKLSEDISWLGAFFHSVSARTAGFSTYSLGTFSNAGLLVLIILMFIGASPGSTGGGIKTSTFLFSCRGLNPQQRTNRKRPFTMQFPPSRFVRRLSLL